MYRADGLSTQKGLAGKFKGEFIPRWVKQELQKQRPSCCVPGCTKKKKLNVTCGFAIFDSICAASNVSTDEAAGATVTSSLSLCTQHYHSVYRHCNAESEFECALCDSKRRHRVASKLRWPFNLSPPPT